MTLKQPLILVVDDDPVSLSVACNALKKGGYSCITATDGQQAIEQCLNAHPFVILMDGQMPVLDGFDACRQIKNHPDQSINSIPIIMITVMDDNDAIDSAFAAGAEDFINKPVNWHILQHRIDLLLKNHLAENALRANENHIQAIAESANDAIISVNHQGNIIFWNHAACELFGYQDSEIIGQNLMLLIPKNAHAGHTKNLALANNIDLSHFSQNSRQLEGLRKNGEIFPLELTLSAWSSNDECFYSCILRDISERIRKENELTKLSMAVKQSPNLVIITNPYGTIEYANPQITSLTGYTDTEVIGKNTNLFHSGNTNSSIYREIWLTIKAGKIWQGSIQNKKKDGELYWAKQSISPIINEEGEITHYISIQEDETKTKALTEEIAYRAAHDALTGLINRHEFESHLSSLIKRSEANDRHALCYLDLDHFKIVNDTCGHPAGDELLRQLSKLMKKAGRKHDILARLGGDEFALILSYCDENQALHIANQLHQIVNQYQLNWNGQIFKVGASIGVVAISKGDIPHNILTYADNACYKAKNNGRNQVYLVDESDKNIRVESSQSHQWFNKITEALTFNHFVLYIQPIVSLTEKSSCSQFAEILIRFQDDSGEIFLPARFFAPAERFNLLIKIDYWVIEQTFAWFTSHLNKLDQFSNISINLSAQSITHTKLGSVIKGLLNKYNFPANKLVLEVYELTAINNLTLFNGLISELHPLGVKFSLDNFSGGMSALNYFKDLPVDFLKIDGVFIRNISHSSVDYTIVKSINQIAKALNKKTIAELIEDKSTAATAKELNIDYAQGFYYKEPEPLEDL